MHLKRHINLAAQPRTAPVAVAPPMDGAARSGAGSFTIVGFAVRMTWLRFGSTAMTRTYPQSSENGSGSHTHRIVAPFVRCQCREKMKTNMAGKWLAMVSYHYPVFSHLYFALPAILSRGAFSFPPLRIRSGSSLSGMSVQCSFATSAALAECLSAWRHPGRNRQIGVRLGRSPFRKRASGTGSVWREERP